MEQRDIDARRAALQNALGIMANSRQQAAGAAAAREQIEMQQPDVWDYLAQAVGAAAPFLMGGYQEPDVAALANAIGGGMGRAAPVTNDASYAAPPGFAVPPGYGAYIGGWA
jgi:hypothetical protein